MTEFKYITIMSNKWLKIVLLVVAYAGITVLMLALISWMQIHFNFEVSEHATMAYLSVFIIAIVSSSTILIPLPITPLIVTAAAALNPAVVVIIACTGSTVGEMTSYLAGYFGRTIIKPEQMKGYDKARNWMNQYGVWTVFGLALVPIIPFDITGLAAGGLKLPLWKFSVACWIGKMPRLFLETYAGASILHLVFPLLFP